MFKNFVIVISLSLLFAGRARGDALEIARLEAERVRLATAQDSLLTERRQAGVEADRLSAQIDSLKVASHRVGDGAALQGALRRSLDVAGRLEALARSLERAQDALEEVRARLRAAYDREIAGLTARLGEVRDEALARMLRTYQRARDALQGAAQGASADPLMGLSIREEDGPEEIRQKADLLTDGAARLRAEEAELARRLRQLETERRLRDRAAVFAREIGVFDEHLPEGRSVASAEQKPGGQGPPEQKGDAGVAPPTSGLVPPGIAQAPGGLTGVTGPGGASVAGKEVVREGDRAPGEALSTEDIDAEIQRLKARRKEAMDRARALTEKADVFQARLRRMLEERN